MIPVSNRRKLPRGPIAAEDAPKKQHSGGRRESRLVPREPEEGKYTRTKRGYLVRSNAICEPSTAAVGA